MEPVRQDREGHAQVCRASRWRPPLRPSAQLHTACGDTETRGRGVGGAAPHLPGRWLRKRDGRFGQEQGESH